mgnify:CR=1 FL=1
MCEEVLPSIRKNGGYLSPIVDFTDPENLMNILSNWVDDKKKFNSANTKIVEYTPKADFTDPSLLGKLIKAQNEGFKKGCYDLPHLI